MASSNKVCKICKFSDTDDLFLGEWRTSEDCTIHLFCALLSTHAVQQGSDSQGIDGFLVSDIEKLIKLGKKCYYCKEKHASVKCRFKKCQRYFHVKCGVENNCLFQFEDQFPSYCHHHVAIQEKYEIHEDWWLCQICHESMGVYNAITSIPSCCDQGYFHKKCALEFAKTAGYIAKCPCCGNAKDKDGNDYRKFLNQRGVFCPDKDADWELSPDAYQSLLYVHNRCDASYCLCPNGREHKGKRGEWRLFKCKYCGGKGMHRGCYQTDISEEYVCDDCNEKSNSLITVFTQNSDVDQNPSTSKSGVHNANNNTTKSDKLGNNSLKSVKVDTLTFRNTTLVMADQNADIDPLGVDKRATMRNTRLDMFFERAKFDVKPPPPPWIV